jgi:hypothetical protein
MISTISSTWMLWIWHLSAASSCNLLENLICFSLVSLYQNVLFASHHLYHVFCLLTLCFFTNRNMVLEVEKTGAVVGFLDPKCLCSTTLTNMDDTVAFSMSHVQRAFRLSRKRNSSLPLISVWTTGLQWRLFWSSRRSTILIHWREFRLILPLLSKLLMSKLFLS